MHSKSHYLNRVFIRLEQAITESEQSENNAGLTILKSTLAKVGHLIQSSNPCNAELLDLSVELALIANEGSVDVEAIQNLAAGIRWLVRPIQMETA